MKLNLPKREPGKAWSIRLVKKAPKFYGQDCWGKCDWSKREIVIWRKAKDAGIARDTLIHELLHMFMPWMDESAVDHMATELDHALDAAAEAGILD